MRTSPYELVFGQPPRQCIFPGASKRSVREEDVEDLLKDGDDNSNDNHPENKGKYVQCSKVSL